MSDINLLKKPGIQNNIEEKEVYIENDTSVNHEGIEQEINIVSNPKKNYLFSLLLVLLLICSIPMYNYYNSFYEEEIPNASISYLLKMTIEESSNMVQLESVHIIDNRIIIKIKYSSDQKLYEKLDLISKFNYNAKGSKVSNSYYLYINEPWKKNKYAKLDLATFQKHISDFKGIESEQLNDTIIIVSNYSNLLSIIDLCEKNNIINSYYFKIEKIIDNLYDNSYYKFIVKEYD